MREFPSMTHTKMSTIVKPHTLHPWRSPVPYLFGGLAAMLGLITFALLLLACSYWRISRRSNGGGEEKQIDSGEEVVAKVLEEKILVIMAGQNNPTFLATPVAAKTCVKCVDCIAKMEDKEGHIGESTVTKGSLFSSGEENQ